MAPMIEIMSLASSASSSGAAAKATPSSSSATNSATSPVLNVNANVNHTSPALSNQQPSVAPLNNPNCVPPPVSISVSVSLSSSNCTSTSANSTANMAKRRRLDCSDGVVLGIDRGPSAFPLATHSAVPAPLGPAIPPDAIRSLFANDSPDTLAVPVTRLTRKCSSSSSTNNADRDNANGGTGIGALAQSLSHCPLSNNIKTERRDSLLAADRRHHSESVSSAAAPLNAAIDSDHKGLLDSDDDEDDPYERRKRELLDGKCLFNFSFFS